ncbi:MAG: Na+/H+ antiporter subunit E [Pirellulaceae bacterium]|nr:Na+/H+ antiporter subunit E [Pirellulaceae bacterium]
MREFSAYGLAWATLWWLLSRGHADSWLVGVPTVLAAAGLSVWMAPPWSWRWNFVGMVRFAGYFVRASLAGGCDVAYRAIHPRLPIHPRMMVYHSRLPIGTAQVFFANAISLSPGTVSARLRHGKLTIHVLDARQPVRAKLAELEQAVGELFGVELPRERTGEETS